MLHRLNLPALPDSIINEVLKYSEATFRELDRCMGKHYQVNVGYLGIYDEHNIVKRHLTRTNFKSDLLQQWFKTHLPMVVHTELFIMKNTGSSPAIFPPHTDMDRKVAINYVFATGGDNVITSTFKGPEDKNISKPRYYHEDNLEIDSKDILPVNTWYIFNAQKPHSVKNIETIRIILVLSTKDNMTLENFIKEYPELLK
jgi:hypothetical protein